MADEHIGCLVLVNCGPNLGTYQGRITKVEPSNQTITLENPLRNGVPYNVAKVTLRSDNIVDLRILQLADEFEKALTNVLSSCRSSGKLAGSSSAVECSGNGHNVHVTDQENRYAVNEETKLSSAEQHLHISPDNLFRGNARKRSTKVSSPYRDNARSGRSEEQSSSSFNNVYGVARTPQDGQRHKHTPVSDLCAPLDFELLAEDFDFEANLAKFEKLPRESGGWQGEKASAKQAAAIGQLFNSLENGTKGNGVVSSPGKNIRHDINIIQDPSRVYVNAKRTWRYMTETGIEVRSLTAAQKRMLFDAAVNGHYISPETFAFSMAENAGRLCLQMMHNKGISTASVYVIFSNTDSVSLQIAKQLSRMMVNRGHQATWIVTGDSYFHQNEFGVQIINNPSGLAGYSHPNSFVFIVGRQGQGVFADQVSSWLCRRKFQEIIVVETNWGGVTGLVHDEDLLLRLGLDGESLVKIPPRVLLFWQLPCDEIDSDLKSTVYICDTNMPLGLIQDHQLASSSKEKDGRQKGKAYKFPFTAGGIVQLRKL